MLAQRIKKLILLRLLFATLLLYAPQFLVEGSPVVFYEALVLICLLSFIYFLWLLTRRRLGWLAVIQILGDILLTTFLVFFAGGTESLFALFYPLSILSSALILGKRQVVFRTTFFSCGCFLLVSLASYEAGRSGFMPRDPIYLYYGTTVRIALFFIVGLLSNYLSQTVLELENQLKLSERLSFLGQVLSKVAHELRNPLSSIRTAAEVLKDSLNGKLAPQEEKMVRIVHDESDRIVKTMERILDYTRAVPPNSKMHLLDGLLDRSLALVSLRSELHCDRIVVEKKYEVPQVHVYADEEQILAVLLNLILNAYQAMPNGGTFRVSAVEDLQGTKIDLEDSGRGIPREKLKDLFLPFKSTKKGGTGLGLAEVHKIITLHEGKIEVEIKSGEGTIFHLFLPKP